MDKAKFRLFKSGLTEQEKDEIAKHEEVEAKFKAEGSKVASTMGSKGFAIIMDKIVDDIEIAKSKLLKCKEKELARLQLEIQVRKEFLDKWSPFAS